MRSEPRTPSQVLADFNAGAAPFHVGIVHDTVVETHHPASRVHLLALLALHGLLSPGASNMAIDDVIHQVNNVNGLEVFITTDISELTRWENERPWESDTPWDID